MYKRNGLKHGTVVKANKPLKMQEKDGIMSLVTLKIKLQNEVSSSEVKPTFDERSTLGTF